MGYKLECTTQLTRVVHYQYRGPDSNRHGNKFPQDFKSCASTNSATPAKSLFILASKDIYNNNFMQETKVNFLLFYLIIYV